MGETVVFQAGETLLSAIASTLSATSLLSFWKRSFSSDDEGWIWNSEVTLWEYYPGQTNKRLPLPRSFAIFVFPLEDVSAIQNKESANERESICCRDNEFFSFRSQRPDGLSL